MISIVLHVFMHLLVRIPLNIAAFSGKQTVIVTETRVKNSFTFDK